MSKFNVWNGMGSLIVAVMLLMSFNVNAAMFQVTSNGEVGAYFAGASAGYENRMNLNFEDLTVDSPFISNRDVVGQYFSYGNHIAGSQVVIANNVVDTGDWFYSIDSFNDDGLRHIQYSSFIMSDGTPVLLVGFEDIMGGGDLDFNDHVVMFTNLSAVPEPETYMMLLVGLLLLSLRAIKRT